MKLVQPVTGATFLGLPAADDLSSLDADAAVLGVTHGTPYDPDRPVSHATGAPAAVRARSARYGTFLAHHDFDFDGPLLGDPPLRAVDCGDVAVDAGDVAGTVGRATEAVRAIRQSGAVPLVLGGDDSIPIPVLRAYEGSEPLQLIQVDAHLDFRDEIHGVRDGYSSPMRRASEMPWVERILHVGMRGVGASRPGDVADTLASGNAIFAARAVRRGGVGPVLEQVPEGARVVITIDVDGLDPAVAPGVFAPSPGGLAFEHVTELIAGVARRGRLAGMIVTEYVPQRDLNGLTSLIAVRLLATALGCLARSRPVSAAAPADELSAGARRHARKR
jgi:agmatinase